MKTKKVKRLEHNLKMYVVYDMSQVITDAREIRQK